MTWRPGGGAPPRAGGFPFWRTAQTLGVVATVVLVAGLLLRPEPALEILWNVAIPLLPASFLVSPALWRNVCPLATLNILLNGTAGRRRLAGRLIPAAGTVGIVLLGVLVPARRFLFNTDGPALAAVILVVAAAALLLGAVFDVKAGFCNAICPVLPVERLYGQHPLVEIGNPRCTPCTLCATRGCIDLAPAKAIAQTLGTERRSHAWLLTGYGVFAAAFPGFVAGYYLTADVAPAAAGSVYLTVGAWAGGSYLLTGAAVRLFRVSWWVAMTALAGTAIGLYYWFVAPIAATTLGLAGGGTVVIRAAALALIAAWLWRAGLRTRVAPPQDT